jgi:hypothetical protein
MKLLRMYPNRAPSYLQKKGVYSVEMPLDDFMIFYPLLENVHVFLPKKTGYRKSYTFQSLCDNMYILFGIRDSNFEKNNMVVIWDYSMT